MEIKNIIAILQLISWMLIAIIYLYSGKKHAITAAIIFTLFCIAGFCENTVKGKEIAGLITSYFFVIWFLSFITKQKK